MERARGGWGARAAWSVLLVLTLVRAATAFVPSMWAWGLNVQRFIPPLLAWLPWAIGALLLHPALAAGVATRLERAGDCLAAGKWTPWLVGLAGAALVWSLPDRTWITGDFLLRQGTAESGAFPTNFVQSLPLEVILNQWVPRMFGAFSQVDPNVANRTLGALAAAGLGFVAVALVREWGFDGSAALVGAGTIFFGGYLTSFTGLGKPAALISLLTALSLLAATRLVTSGRGGGLLGVSVGIAFLVHRSAMALAPLWVAALILARRGRTPLPGATRGGLLLAVALPLACAVLAAPIILGIVLRYDLPQHLAPPDVLRRGWLGAAVAPMHLLDLANLLLLYTPALATALALIVFAGPRTSPRPETGLVGLLGLSFVPVLLFVHPIQGVFRDLEVFAPAGVALALASAHVVGGALQQRRLPAWLAPALLASVVVPSGQWLVHFHDPADGLRRARSYGVEAPVREDRELAMLWDVIAYRAFRLHDWSTAVEASERSVRHASHPRSLMMLAIARTYTGDYRGAESLYVVLAERTPDDPLAWVGLGGAALRLGDSLQAARALARLEAYAPDGREARLIRRHLRVFPEVWPAAAALPGGRGPGRPR